LKRISEHLGTLYRIESTVQRQPKATVAWMPLFKPSHTKRHMQYK
jgi:hypothetical protein